MDINNTLKTEVFKPVVTILIPGLIALLPYSILFYLHYPYIHENLEKLPSALLFTIITLAAIAAGMVIEDIGSRVEDCFDKMKNKADKACTTANDPSFYDIWNTFLATHFEKEPIGLKYMSTIVTRLKYELSLLPATLLFLIGFSLLYYFHPIVSLKVFSIVIVLLLVFMCYLIFEIMSGVELLGNLRRNSLSGVHVVGIVQNNKDIE